ncbi:hypothetical protein E2320_013810 [Naja naja]|nr:hypothetical protein E2320_013810 [Naja naja]
MASSELWAIDYEIYGEVQASGTVTGQVQGPKEKVEMMKNWLRSIGSPMSRIDQAVFSNERQITALEFQSFTTKY